MAHSPGEVAWVASVIRQCQPAHGDALVIYGGDAGLLAHVSQHWPGPVVRHGDHGRAVGEAIIVGRRVHAAAAPDADLDAYAKARAGLEAEHAAHVVNRATMIVRGVEWSDLCLRNAAKLPGSCNIDELRGIAKGRPVFLVAPGPSLDSDAEYLADARTKGLIICGQHSLGALYRIGIRPDFVCAFESRDVTPHFPTDPSMYRRLIVPMTAHPALLNLPAERLYMTAAGNLSTARKLCEAIGYGHLPGSGASVSTVAYALAEMMEPAEIVLVGHDMAYTDGRLYAEGTFRCGARLVQAGDSWHVARPKDEMDAADAPDTIRDAASITMVEAIGGEQCPATPQLLHQRRWLEQRCQVAGAIPATNTGHGARIEGMQHRPLTSVLDRHRPMDRLVIPRGPVLADSNRRKIRQLARQREAFLLRLASQLERSARRARERPAGFDSRDVQRTLSQAWDIGQHLYGAQLKAHPSPAGAAENMDIVRGFALGVARQWGALVRELGRG